MVESKKHQKLKTDMADILQKIGYDVSIDERLVGPRGGMTKVDIIGENAGNKIAIEIGPINSRKFDQLSRNYGFDQVLHIPDRDNLQEAIGMLGSDLSLKYDEDVGGMEFIEEAGVVTLSPFWGESPQSSSEKPQKAKISDWRLLRNNFGPVATGIELYISYGVGNGYYTVCACEEFQENAECEHTKLVNDFGERLNLDKHIQGVADRSLTDGFCIVEIVYDRSDSHKFESFKLGSTPEEVCKDLGSISRLKIIDAGKHTIDIERESTYDIQYYEIDRDAETPIKLHPWEVGNFSWNLREPNILGESIVAPAERYSEWLLNIQKSYAKGVYRQGNPIPIFTGENWGKKQIIALRNLIRKREQSGGMGALVFGGKVTAQLLGVEGEMLSRAEAFNHYTEMIASSMTVPSFFFNVSSSGRADTAQRQMELFEIRVGRFTRMLKRLIEGQYFKWIIREEFDDDAPVPRVMFNVPSLHVDENIKKLRQLLAVRYLSPEFREAVERQIAEAMGIKLPDKLTILTPGPGKEGGEPSSLEKIAEDEERAEKEGEE